LAVRPKKKVNEVRLKLAECHIENAGRHKVSILLGISPTNSPTRDLNPSTLHTPVRAHR
jgi:hypothetical protein